MLLEYVLRGQTGEPEASGCKLEWPNGIIDEGHPVGLCRSTTFAPRSRRGWRG